jgi:hypothetical protein
MGDTPGQRVASLSDMDHRLDIIEAVTVIAQEMPPSNHP